VPNTWVATGLDDQYVVTLIGDSRIEASGPALGERRPGTQTLKKNGTIVWLVGNTEFTGRPVKDTLVMTARNVPHPGKIVFTRADEATVKRTLATLPFINQGLQQALRLRTAPPKIIAQSVLLYPSEMKRAGIEGSVTVWFQLSVLGLVEDAKIEKSTRPEFEAPALAAIRNSIFRPGIRNGELVRTRMSQEILFTISHEEKEATAPTH
jgi:TonB family protein